MIDSLLPPLILLSGAALTLAVTVVPAWRGADWNRYLRLGMITLALIAVLLTGNAVAESHQLSRWSSEGMLTPPLTLQGNEPGRLLGAALLVSSAAAALIAGSRDDASPAINAKEGALLLVVLAASLVSMLPANLLTLTLVWAALDGVLMLAWFVAYRPADDREWQTYLLNGSSGLIATLFLWSASLSLQSHHAFQDLTSLAPSDWTGIALALAAILRLSPYPVHLLRRRAGPLGDLAQNDLIGALQAGSAMAGVWLLARVTGWEMLPELGRQLISAFLLTGLVACGLLAWLSGRAPRSTGWILTSQAGLIVLAGIWAGPYAALAEGMVLILVSSLLTTWPRIDQQSVERLAAGGIGIAALAGVPLTWGANSRFALYQSWLENGWGLYLFLAVGASLLLLAAAGRSLIRTGTIQPSYRNKRAILGVALGIPAAGLLIRSGPVFPEGRGLVWFVILASVGGAALLTWGAESLQPLQGQAAERLQALLTLGWLRRCVTRSGRLIGSSVQALHQVLEGEGALLWVVILLILGWILLSGSSLG